MSVRWASVGPLKRIEADAHETVASIRPRVASYNDAKSFSAIVVTAMI